MINLTDQQLQDFQEAIAWKTGMRLPDGRILGVPGKRGGITEDLDPRVQLVAKRLNPKNKTIVEIGSCEGIHTVQLAGICKQVIGLEVRPRNIICALTRVFVHDVPNARFVIRDVRSLDASIGPIDIVFHVGVLYHLTDPVSHLMRLATLAPDLVLDTHYASDALPWPPVVLPWGQQRYRGKVYREAGWHDSFSGVDAAACWLDRAELLRLLADAGYASVEVVEDRLERNGPRLTLLARRPAGSNPVLSENEFQDRERHLQAVWEDTMRKLPGPTVGTSTGRIQGWLQNLGNLAAFPLRALRSIRTGS